MEFNTLITVAQLKAQCKKDRVDIVWERVPEIYSTTLVKVDDEKFGIYTEEGVYVGRCIVWGN
jgi:hypothetical protein